MNRTVNLIFLSTATSFLYMGIGFVLTFFLPALNDFHSADSASKVVIGAGAAIFFLGSAPLVFQTVKAGSAGTKFRWIAVGLYTVSFITFVRCAYQATASNWRYKSITSTRTFGPIDPQRQLPASEYQKYNAFSFQFSAIAAPDLGYCRIGAPSRRYPKRYCVSPLIASSYVATNLSTNVTFWAASTSFNSWVVPDACNSSCVGLRMNPDEEAESYFGLAISTSEETNKQYLDASDEVIFIKLVESVDLTAQAYFMDYVTWVITGCIFSAVLLFGGLVHALKTGFRWSPVISQAVDRDLENNPPSSWLPSF